MKRTKQRTGPATVTVGNVEVKIYQRSKKVNGENYQVFEVADFSTGRRRLRSFSDRGEALKEAQRLATLLAAGEVRVAEMKAPEAASYGRAVQLLKDSGIPLELVAARYAECVKILGGDRVVEAAKYFARHNPDSLPPRTVAEVKDELIAAKGARGKSARYLADLRSRLTRFAETFQVPVSSITTGDVQRWLDGLKGEPQTAKNYRTVARTLFSFAEARGYIFKGSNPVLSTEKIDVGNEGAVEIYSPIEIQRLLAAAPEDFKPAVAIQAFGGLRTAEVLRLEWSDIDLRGGLIHVSAEKSKTASRRLVPIASNLKNWLAPFARKSGKVWEGTETDMRDARGATAKAAGIPWKQNALRHSFVSYRLAEVQSAAQVSLEAGNSAQVVFRHYREIVRPEAAKAWFAISPEQPANVTTLEVAND